MTISATESCDCGSQRTEVLCESLHEGGGYVAGEGQEGITEVSPYEGSIEVELDGEGVTPCGETFVVLRDEPPE